MRDTPCHAEEADRLTKHLLPMHTVEATDSSTPLRSAQNDTANLTTHPEVTHDVKVHIFHTIPSSIDQNVHFCLPARSMCMYLPK